MVFQNKRETERILEALAAQMAEFQIPAVELLVCGGSALNVIGFLERPTKDVDVVAWVERDLTGEVKIHKASEALVGMREAIAKVARDFNLPENWMNPGPESVLDFGMPEGFFGRIQSKTYLERLVLHFLSRFDQICFKFYAAVDQGPGKHLDDLLKLKPNSEELWRASQWCMTHDVSEAFRDFAKSLLRALGHDDVAERI